MFEALGLRNQYSALNQIHKKSNSQKTIKQKQMIKLEKKAVRIQVNFDQKAHQINTAACITYHCLTDPSDYPWAEKVQGVLAAEVQDRGEHVMEDSFPILDLFLLVHRGHVLPCPYPNVSLAEVKADEKALGVQAPNPAACGILENLDAAAAAAAAAC